VPAGRGTGILRNVPTYDYRCNDCGETFEIWQSFAEDALTECPTCEGELKKVYSKVGISFKGDGFYKNDHGSSGISPNRKVNFAVPNINETPLTKLMNKGLPLALTLKVTRSIATKNLIEDPKVFLDSEGN